MNETSEIKKLPSQIIFENLRELLRAKNTAHESMFRFSWKKMWPFSLIFPQVDYERIIRLMDEIRKNVASQKNLVQQARQESKDFEKRFLEAVPAYLDSLDISCKFLAAVAQWKQDMLEKKLHHKIKAVRDVSEYNRLLKDYEKAQSDLVRAGAFVQIGWADVTIGLSKA